MRRLNSTSAISAQSASMRAVSAMWTPCVSSFFA